MKKPEIVKLDCEDQFSSVMKDVLKRKEFAKEVTNNPVPSKKTELDDNLFHKKSAILRKTLHDKNQLMGDVLIVVVSLVIGGVVTAACFKFQKQLANSIFKTPLSKCLLGGAVTLTLAVSAMLINHFVLDQEEIGNQR